MLTKGEIPDVKMGSLITVYDIGTRVLISESIPGLVIGIWIRGSGNVEYQCVWWSGNERRSEWLGTNEISATDPGLTVIGFRG